MSVIEIEIHGNADKDSVAITIFNDQSVASKQEVMIHTAIVDMVEAFLKSHKRFNAASQKSKVCPIVKKEGGAK